MYIKYYVYYLFIDFNFETIIFSKILLLLFPFTYYYTLITIKTTYKKVRISPACTWVVSYNNGNKYDSLRDKCN